MKYMAIIDAEEKPVSCEFIGCNGNVAPYLIGATTDIKALEQKPCWIPISDKQTNLTAEEAIAVIEREIACVNKECNIERACGQCELVMPSKEPIIEAYKLAIEALKTKPCEDCISRQTVLDIVNNPLNIRLDEIIKKLPPVTPKSKTAHWIHFANSDDCSGCGWSIGKYISPSDYCPKCGARMIEPAESEEQT